ncbi:MAG: phosphohydrolase, partial [Chryseobacterium sp.]
LILTICVSTMIFSILATRPTLPSGRYTDMDLQEKKVNLLFFGNFYRMNLEEYSKGMRLVMDDRDFLYGTLVKDVYSQGVVLGRKYRLLRISYNIFMFGLVASTIAFVIASLMADK